MRVPGAFALLGALAIAGRCSERTAKPIQSEQWKLPTGRTVRPLKVWRSSPDIDPPFLLLAYATSLSVRDTLALREEARAVWPQFLPLVRRSGVSKAMLQANARPFFLLRLPFLGWFHLPNQFTFVLNRQLDGTWRISGDTVSLSGGGIGTAFPSFGAKCTIAPLAPRQSGTPPCVKRSILARPDSR
jgi:hypothetical protein